MYQLSRRKHPTPRLETSRGEVGRVAQPGGMGETAAEVASSYRAELEELTFNSKPIINSLTMIAEELLPHAGVIVEVVDSKIRSAPADQKLPVIYLMDSIVKNIGGAYKEQFARHVPELIGLTYAVATPKVMMSLKNLAKTWDGVFPADVVERVTAGLSGGGAAPSAPRRRGRCRLPTRSSRSPSTSGSEPISHRTRRLLC